jgi:hypothetical protein
MGFNNNFKHNLRFMLTVYGIFTLTAMKRLLILLRRRILGLQEN